MSEMARTAFLGDLAASRDEITWLQAQLRQVRERRDDLIMEAVASGLPYRALEKAAGISNVAITYIVAKRRRGPGDTEEGKR